MAFYGGRGLHGQTVEAVADMIFAGEFREGDGIDVAALQERLGVSSTALREALKVLTAKGLILARPKRGTFVRPRSDWNLLDGDVIRWKFAAGPDDAFLRDLHEIRSIIEPSVAGLAASRRDAVHLITLERALQRMERARGDVTEVTAADVEFHRALHLATGNEMLIRMDVMINAGLAGRDALTHGAAGGADTVPGHRAVLEAVRAGDGDAAEEAMRALLPRRVRT
ncbi:FadR/GntR family transcriptional regulator [Actinoallomurus rhizosphaericola]|uniref:FadR/GntR family transcriptional regulator n=1 Tax=Actinoallomurus rhizosphaericola TaxID=2952536 RepID=UPI0020905473|nr:FadR/GntR family transcriptional regulator [Actinoallomurus rhizosphaericola]MCO5993284.1 FadR family transcriptional regulator [Actinoallomurus rhizosphaericola]